MNARSSLHGRSALITGAEAGLGFAIADALVRAGATVIVHSLCDDDARRAQSDLRRAYGTRVLCVHADLRDVDQIETLIRQVQTELPSLDILVNNAVVRHFEPAHELPRAHWDEALAR